MMKKQIIDYLKYLKTPLDITDSKEWKPKEIEVLKNYQNLAPKLFNDLKSDNCLTFEDVFPTRSVEALDERLRQNERFVKFTRIASNISNNLPKSSMILGAEEQWTIFLSLYLSQCEQIKSLFEDYILKVNRRLPEKKRECLKSFVTLGPLISVLKKYKSGKYAHLFTEIDVDLRNAVAHLKYDFVDDEVGYGKNKRITTHNLIFKYRMISALLAILFGNKTKAFAKEFEELAREKGAI